MCTFPRDSRGLWNMENMSDVLIYCRVQKHIKAHNMHVFLVKAFLQWGQYSAKPTASENKLYHHHTRLFHVSLFKSLFQAAEGHTSCQHTALGARTKERSCSLPNYFRSSSQEQWEKLCHPPPQEQVTEPSTHSTASSSFSLSFPFTYSQQLIPRRGGQN